MSQSKLSRGAARVESTLNAFGMGGRVKELEASSRTAEDAAAAVACDVAQIVKSLIFKTEPSDRALLVLTSGRNQVDISKLAQLVDETVSRADADFVRAKTGFAIGGVPPIAHKEQPIVLIDKDLMQFDILWAAAGTPRALFQLSAQELAAITEGAIAEVAL